MEDEETLHRADLTEDEVRKYLLSSHLLPSDVGDITMTAIVDEADSNAGASSLGQCVIDNSLSSSTIVVRFVK